MGQNQSCPTIIQEKCNKKIVTNIDAFDDSIIQEEFQEYDNPSRNMLKTDFLNSKKCIANDLNMIDSNKQIQSIPYCSTKRFSLFKIDSINLDENVPEVIDFDDRIKESIKDKKRTSLSYNLQDSQIKKSLYQNVKSYVMSEKNLYNQIEIKSGKFVQLKVVEDINLYYKICQKIGEGTFGNVYKAICLKTSSIRAIKILKRRTYKRKLQNHQNQKFKQTITEIQILKSLDHPNIIKVFEVYYSNDNYYIVTQFCAGGSIMTYLKQNNGYCQNIVKAIMRQILSAVAYLHSHKIAHRDLKLQNIVFIKKISPQSKTQDVQIKIIDFGSALQLKYSHNNRDAKLIGTINYMAPQVIQGSYSEKCDIWSCGVILHILLTGKSPFKKWNKDQTIKCIQQTEIQFKQSQWQQVPASAKILISKMLEKQPLRRINAKQALKSSWLTETEKQSLKKQTMTQIVKRLYSYYRGNNLVSVLQSYLTFLQISQQQRSEIAKLFKTLDKDSSGTIEIAELKEAFLLYNEEDVTDQINYILGKIDKNKSKKIDLSEFISAMYDREKLFHQNSLQMAFNYFDTDNNGFIEKKQLKNVLKGCDKKQFQFVLKDLDENGDDKISKQEFFKYFKQKKFL